MLKIGDRCIVTFSSTGLDEGKIVDVTGYFNSNVFEGQIWVEGLEVIITTLSGPLHSVQPATGLVTLHTSRPYKTSWLRKLPEVTANDDERVLEERP